MKELGYIALKKFSYNSSGPFGFFDLWRGNKCEAYWSDEDFGFVLFHIGREAL